VNGKGGNRVLRTVASSPMGGGEGADAALPRLSETVGSLKTILPM
jgi:hypothetical protein